MTKHVPNQSILMHQNVPAGDIPGLCFTAHIVSDIAELKHLVRPWERLAEMAVCLNPYLDPDFLIPALRHLAENQVQVLIVSSYPQSNSSGIPAFCGLMPFITKKISVPGKKRYQRSVAGVEIWQHQHCKDCTPLIRKEVAAETLDFMINYIRDDLGAQLIRTNNIRSETAFTGLLGNVLDARHGSTCSTKQLAAEPKELSSQTTPHPGRDRVVCANLRQKLSVRGQVETTYLANQDDSTWIDAFLRLEASNRMAPITDHARSHASNSFFREMASQMLANGKMTICKTTLSQQPIAMSCDLNHRQSIHDAKSNLRFKVAYVESLRDYLPALLPDCPHGDCSSQNMTFSTQTRSNSKPVEIPVINRLAKFKFRKTTPST